MENQEIKEIIDNIKKVHSHISIDGMRDAMIADLWHIKMNWRDPNGIEARGFASDYSLKLAVIKSYSELIERLALKLSFRKDSAIKSSNGFSAHRSFELARNNALFELIERDALLTSWLAKRCPVWLSESVLFQLGFTKAMLHRKAFHAYGLDFKIGIVAITGSKYYTVIGSLVPKNIGHGEIGFAIDTCTHLNLTKAVHSVFQGICFYATLIKNRKDKNHPLFKGIELSMIRHPGDHLEFYLNPKNFSHDWFFKNSSEFLKLELPHIDFYELKLDVPLAYDIFICRGSAKEMQNYYTGLTTNQKLNIKRLHQVIKDIKNM